VREGYEGYAVFSVKAAGLFTENCKEYNISDNNTSLRIQLFFSTEKRIKRVNA